MLNFGESFFIDVFALLGFHFSQEEGSKHESGNFF